jgi:hypothetical protein
MGSLPAQHNSSCMKLTVQTSRTTGICPPEQLDLVCWKSSRQVTGLRSGEQLPKGRQSQTMNYVRSMCVRVAACAISFATDLDSYRFSFIYRLESLDPPEPSILLAIFWCRQGLFTQLMQV